MTTLTERQRNRVRKRKAELALLSGGAIGVDVDVENDNLTSAKLAKELSRQIIDKRDRKNGSELVLSLQKLGNRGPNAQDLASLLHYVLIGNFVGKPNWLHFKDMRKHIQTVLLRVNCLERHLRSTGDFINEFFEKRWMRMEQEVCNRSAFWRAITHVKQSKLAMLKQKISENGDMLEELRGNDLKLSMLMSLDQMIASQYPLGDCVTESSGAELRIIPTKRQYWRPTNNSPIFVMDCEMCLTVGNRSELTRISIVREDGSILFDTFVKPLAEITNYLTEHSGITAEMLADVNVQLLDVQRAIRRLLPPDAILCGHSLEFDLRALQMSHPFCIDLSTHFNFSNNPRLKTSLRTLSQIFLREDIQRTKSGHCSVEDSLATLKLLRLKMERGLVFGNVMLGWSFKQWAAENGLSDLGTRSSDIVKGAQRIMDVGNGQTDVPVNISDEPPVDKAAAAARRCVQCTAAIWIDCKIGQCLCTRFMADRPVDTAAVNSPAIQSSEQRQHAATQLCVSCISASCVRTTVEPTVVNQLPPTFETKPPTDSDNGEEKAEDEDSNSSVDARNNNDLERLMGDDETDNEDDGAETFDFRSALRINVSRSKVRLSDVLANAGDTKTSFLCAIRNPSEFVSSCRRCRSTPVTNTTQLVDEVVPSLIEYNAAVLEADCDDDAATSQQIDGVVRAVVEAICMNGLVMLVLTSPKRALLYIKLKK